MSTIAENLGELGITISHTQMVDLEKMVIHFSLRKTNPLTLNGIALGVHPIAFTTADTNALFDLFHVRKQDVENKIKACHAIDRSFIVTSDPFNVLTVWLLHLATIYIKDPIARQAFMKHLATLWEFRIFTSVVNHSWQHGANEGVMQAAIVSLSKKSDVIRLGSWMKLIDSHVDKLLDPHDRFYPTLVQGGPDEAFLRVISDTQTALRAKIVTFAQAYYEAYQRGDSIDSKSPISQNKEGERIIAQSASVIDSATQAMVAEILNPNTFVHDPSVDDVAKLFTTISTRQLKTTLLHINEAAQLQLAHRNFDKIDTTKEGKVIIGIRALVLEIIRTMVSICRDRKINMGDRAHVFETMRNVYSSSRQLDPDILSVKQSVTILTDPFHITSNPASQAALRLAVIYYILYRSILKMR